MKGTGKPRRGIDERLAQHGYVVLEDVVSKEAVLDPLLACLSRNLAARASERSGPAPIEMTASRGPSSRPAPPAALAEDEAVAPARVTVRRCGDDDTGEPGGQVTRQLLALAGAGETWMGQALDVSLPQGGVDKATPMLLEPEVFALLADPALLDVLEGVLGPTIWLSPVGHTRLKLPRALAPSSNGILGDVPWHQDNGVLLEEADDLDVVTVWIPLLDATLETGCLQVIPTPRRAALLDHCGGRGGLRIPDAILPASDPVPLPMRRGSVLLMHARTVHSSLPNQTTTSVRISMDLRYQAVEHPTGRPQFPACLLRDVPSSQRQPVDFAQWRARWLRARDDAAGRQLGAFNRWDLGAPVCA